MRIWDCVIVSGESDLDLLEARFTEYEALPVVHVIAEAVEDYQGKPKSLHFFSGAYEDRFRPWHGRWNHVRVEAGELPKDGSATTRKNALRDYLSHAVAGEPDDIILHGNIDEIPSARTLKGLLDREAVPPVGMEMRWCAYRADLVHPHPWRGTVAQEWRLVGSFAGMREKRLTLPVIVDAGTRLSMLDIEPPEGNIHPDGRQLRKCEIDETWPKWVHMKFPC